MGRARIHGMNCDRIHGMNPEAIKQNPAEAGWPLARFSGVLLE